MNSRANLTVFTLKKGYARNVCDVLQFDTFAYFYAISNYFLLLQKYPLSLQLTKPFTDHKCHPTLALFADKRAISLPLRLIVLLWRQNTQNCSFCDKSMKLPRITNLYKVNIFWYGAIPNLHPEPSYAHVKKWHIRPVHWNEAELKCLFLSLFRITLPRCSSND